MLVSKRALLASSPCLVIGLSTGAMAQTKGNRSLRKSATIGEGEAVMIGPKGQRLHKSKVKISAAQHEAAMKKGAREVKAWRRALQARRQALHVGRQRQREGVVTLPGQFRRRLLRLARLPIGINVTGASGTGNRAACFLFEAESLGPRGALPCRVALTPL